jgi:hypothetical protein
MPAHYDANPATLSTRNTAHATATINTNGGRVDLSGDNELPGLLAEQERLAALAKKTEADLAKTRKRIAENMGDASSGTLPGWKLQRVTRHRNGYTVKAYSYTYVRAERVNYDFS